MSGGHDHRTWHAVKGRVKRALGWFTGDRHVEAAGAAEASRKRPTGDREIERAEEQVKARYGEEPVHRQRPAEGGTTPWTSNS
jgi:uncharacterized protein YjbJ (UPF0337 family)